MQTLSKSNDMQCNAKAYCKMKTEKERKNPGYVEPCEGVRRDSFLLLMFYRCYCCCCCYFGLTQHFFVWLRVKSGAFHCQTKCKKYATCFSLFYQVGHILWSCCCCYFSIFFFLLSLFSFSV